MDNWEVLIGLSYQFLLNAPLLRRSVVPDREMFEGCSYLVVKSEGFSLKFDQWDRLEAIFLYSEGLEGHHAFTYPLPSGLKLEMARADVRRLLGPPATSRDIRFSRLFGRHLHAYDSYSLGGIKIHIEYTMDAIEIVLITLTKPKASSDHSAH